MKKISILFYLFIVFSQSQIQAKEGMWIPLLIEELNYDDLKANGFNLTVDDIYSINQACLKDAVVIFGRGCTGEIISKDGLLITNHHCGFDQIQKHSSLENNYLKNGFWAKSREEELPNKGLSVKFLVEIKEFTSTLNARIPKGIDLTTERELTNFLIDSLEIVISDSLKIEASIEKFFEGNQYYLFLYKKYTDVRLVGAPPTTIGNFGGDTDNWVWPRHTGDFSLFRVYSDSDGEPAPYSTDNVPLSPKMHLTISAKGIKENDFTMVLGYPGSTYEYLYSTELEMFGSEIYPNSIKLRDGRLAIIDHARETDEKIYIQYASKQKGISNAWKKWKGILYGFNRFNVIEERKAYEAWLIENSNTSKAQLQEIYEMFDDTYMVYVPYKVVHDYYRESLLSIEPIAAFSRRLADPLYELAYTANKDIAYNKVRKVAADYFKNYNLEIDKQLTRFLLNSFIHDVEDSFIPPVLKDKQSEEALDKYITTLYSKSILVDSARFYKSIEKIKTGKTTTLEKDPFIELYSQVADLYNTVILEQYNYYNDQLNELNKLYMPLITKIDTQRAIYPDANFTMRMTYGKVEGYSSFDALNYSYQTYLDGIIEKGDVGYDDYEVPEKLLELYQLNDYGRYADSTGKVPVCFVASNHTSGGNSGSPVLDANGRLIGINFDRTWEGTMSDYNFDVEICRNISVDIRYILFIIDKFADSAYLLDEMDIIW